MALESFQKLSAAAGPLPAVDSFLIARVIAKLRNNPEVVATDAARRAAVQKHGKDNGQGQTVVSQDAIANFLAEYEPVASQLIELDIEPLPLSILEHAPKMTPEDMVPLVEFLASATQVEG
jgi:hypothetical protein